MRVKLLCNLGTNDYQSTPFKDGEEHEVDPDFGAILVSRGHAVDITPPPVAAPVAAPVVVETVEVVAPAGPDKPKDKFQRMRGK
jgi:hypothetical protein